MNTFIESQNQIIVEHAKDIEQALKSKSSMSHNSFKVKSRTKPNLQTGAIDRISNAFVRHGIYVEKGVGRGRGIHSGRTTPNEWFNPVMREQVPLLADDLGANAADLLVKALIK